MVGNSRRRKAMVMIAIEAYSTWASSSAASGATSLSNRAVAAAGVARTTASACTSWGSCADPTTRFQPPPDRWARSRTVASVRTSAPAWSTTACGSWPRPPASPAKTGTSEGADDVAAAAARSIDLSRSSSATTWGTVARAESWRACPAYTPPSRGSTRRSTTSLPKRSSISQPTLTSLSPIRVAGSTASRAARARPALEITPLSASALASTGTPMSVRGIGTMAPRDHRLAVIVSGWTSLSPRPTSRASAVASGRRLSIDSAPTSTVMPATSARASLPPTDGDPSRTVTRR